MSEKTEIVSGGFIRGGRGRHKFYDWRRALRLRQRSQWLVFPAIWVGAGRSKRSLISTEESLEAIAVVEFMMLDS